MRIRARAGLFARAGGERVRGSFGSGLGVRVFAGLCVCVCVCIGCWYFAVEGWVSILRTIDSCRPVSLFGCRYGIFENFAGLDAPAGVLERWIYSEVG